MFDGPTQKKIMKVDDVGDSDADISGYDSASNQALREIDGVQNELDILNEKGSEEILQVEQKYNKLRKPLFDRRNEIMKTIPHFWLTVFVNHPQISTLITAEEEDCLRFITVLEVEEFEDIKSGYSIKFHFEENPYLENDVLMKEFHLGSSGEPQSKSTEIRWKPGHELNKPPKQSKGRKRPIENESFFKWFSDNSNPTEDIVAETIKDDVWPNPLDYFLIPDIAVENGNDEEEVEEEAEEDGDGVDEEEDGDDVEEEDGAEEDGVEEVLIEDSDEEVE